MSNNRDGFGNRVNRKRPFDMASSPDRSYVERFLLPAEAVN